MKSLEIIYLVTAILLTTATQLRFPGTPIGIGEIILSLWIILSIIKIIINKYLLITPLVKLIGTFWLLAFTSLTLGLSVSDSINLKSDGWSRDYFAFGFSFIFSLCLTHSKFFYSQIQKMIDYMISFSMVALLTIFLFPSSIPFLNPWYSGIRFRGWAENPNQIALLLSIIPFFALHLLFNKSSNLLSKIWYILLIITCLTIGIATDSDAIKIGWLTGSTIIIFLIIHHLLVSIFSSQHVVNFLKKSYQSILGIIIILIKLICFKNIYKHINMTLESPDNKGDDGRIILWQHGIDAIYNSPLFGLGPGAHSGENAPFLNFEAHNTFIDWGSSSGIVGIISYILLVGSIAWQAWKRQSFVMFAAVICLIIFSCFHYVLRHPIFWFYLLSIHSLTSQTAKIPYQIYKN